MSQNCLKIERASVCASFSRYNVCCCLFCGCLNILTVMALILHFERSIIIGTLFQHNLNIAVSSLKWHFPESSMEGNFTYTVRRVICVVVVQKEGSHSKPKMASITTILPAGPDCPLNRNYLRRLRHSLITRSSPPDFSARNRSALILLSCKKVVCRQLSLQHLDQCVFQIVN